MSDNVFGKTANAVALTEKGVAQAMIVVVPAEDAAVLVHGMNTSAILPIVEEMFI